MAWEKRGSGRYYYRKCRLDGKVVSKYIGGGLLAALSVKADVADRRHRLVARRDLAASIQEQCRVDQAIDNYRTQVRQIVRAVLQQAGFHQWKGLWRLKRKAKAHKMVDPPTEWATPTTTDHFYDLLRAAEKSAKPADIEKFRHYTRAHPGLFEGFSILAHSTLQRVVESTNMSEPTKILIAGEIQALRHELGEATASPLEKLLIEDVVLCWLRLQLFEQLYSHDYSVGMSFAYAGHLERSLSAIRRRYLQSIESLARVRGLLTRAGVQINVAQNQIVKNG